MSSGSNFRTVLTFSSTWLLLTAFIERLHREIGQREELMLMLMWRRGVGGEGGEAPGQVWCWQVWSVDRPLVC